MNNVDTFNILDLIDSIGEDDTKNILFSFSCPFNPEIEHFLKDNAIQFAKKKMSITYLVLDNNKFVLCIEKCQDSKYWI